MSYFCCNKCNGTFDPAFTYCPVCEDVPLIEQLQAKNAELTAEVEEQRSDHMKLVEENHELRQQLAIAEEHNFRMREALRNLDDYCDPANHTSFCECDPTVGYQCAVCHWPQIQEVAEARAALSTPASREALDKYVAEKSEAAYREARKAHDQFESALTKQRDLAVSAATKARNAAQQCASVCSKHLDVYPALMNMIDVVDCALSAINESEKTIVDLKKQRDLAVDALEYHQSQTRPIENTMKALAAIKESEV